MSLVKRTRSALLSRDPKAKVMLAGLPTSRTPRAVAGPRFLRSIYRVRRARSAFDSVAVHPYAGDARGVLRAVVAMRKGSFWRENRTVPYRPVTDWQVWNEPNYPAYWDGRPNARQYVSLVQRTRSALRSRDRRAKVLLAGMPNSKTPRSVSASRFLRQIYRVRGARAAFDGVGVHPYARDARGVLRAL